jgi:uncharacterized damage-inducible protein DinB
MTRQDLQGLFQFHQFVLGRNLDGLTHADSLVQATPGGSSIHWIVGHLLATRSAALRLLGEPPLWSDAEAAPFARGSRPADPQEVPVPFEHLLDDLRRSDDLIRAGLDRVCDEDLGAPLGQGRAGTVGDQLVKFHYHEGYHAGQIGVLRRVAGRPPGIS